MDAYANDPTVASEAVGPPPGTAEPNQTPISPIQASPIQPGPSEASTGHTTTEAETETSSEALRQRIAGMEGKLRESAQARKSADQARMEAERHLAEASHAQEVLREEVSRLEARLDELEHRLENRDAEIARLGSEVLSLSAERDALHHQLITVRARMPDHQGGTLSIAAAGDAAAAFARLRQVLRLGGSRQNTDTRRAIAEAERHLRETQLTMAWAVGAHGLYRVRPRDTLAQISSRFYGTSSQWRFIFDANRHLLDDPDELVPGMTLVVP